MSLIVIGGHSRSVGKTSVVAGLISALPEFQWTALKITQYGHGICSASGKACHCASEDHSWAISEEKDRSGKSDSSRFLTAGAVRALWVRTEQGRLAEAMPSLRQKIAAAANVIVESNSILWFLRRPKTSSRRHKNSSIGPVRSFSTRVPNLSPGDAFHSSPLLANRRFTFARPITSPRKSSRLLRTNY